MAYLKRSHKVVVLSVHQRIDFKVLVLVYKALKGLGPKSISELLTQKLLTAYVLHISGATYFSCCLAD